MKNKCTLKNITLLWGACFLIAATVLSFTHFKSESNDSKYYTELVVRYQNAPLSQVISPKWGVNYWGFEPNSYMRDQFPGQLIMGVALTKLGIPAEQALHILGMLFQISSFLLLALIAYDFFSIEGALFLLSSLLLTPLAFSYNIRANHELGIMFFSILSLYSGYKLHQSKNWIIPAVISSASLLLIKGPFFIFSPALLVVGYLFSNNSNRFKMPLITIAVILSLCSVMIATIGFESLFMKVTGDSFLREFWRIQIEQRAMAKTQGHFFIVQKILNFYYYFSHYLAYALPWSFILLMYVILKKRTREFVLFLKTPISLLFFFSSMTFCLFFSISDRVAGRYTFPGYFLFAAWTALAIYSMSDLLKAKVALHKDKFFFAVPLLWLLAFSLHFL